MTCKNYWWVTRPKRKLILIPDLIKIFSATVQGQKWYGNRDLHLQFESNLKEAKWKAQNISKDGSGGRTYAALLAQFGLWYHDESGYVQITMAGKEIIEGYPPVPIMTKQLLDLQFPSYYSLKPNVNVCRDFRIQPFRFIVELFLEGLIEELTQDDIAFCLVPYAKKSSDKNICIDKIYKFRENSNYFTKIAVSDTGKNEGTLRNIGNTFVNNLEYTGYFEDQEEIKSLKFRPEKVNEAAAFMSQLRKGLIGNPEDEQTFQRHYGRGLEITKDYSDSIRKPMAIDPNEKKIIERFYIISSSEPVYSISPRLIRRISSQTGAPYSMVRSVIEKLPIESQPSQFRDSYLKISTSGTEFAKEFELKTANLFNEGFEIDAEWIGNLSRNPDIIIFIDKRSKKHGIIDTKAYKKYNLPYDHKLRMANSYIPKFKDYKYQGETYQIKFFGYVAGGFSDNIDNSFNELVKMTEISGHLITAQNLINLLEIHKERHLSLDELTSIFTCNKEVRPYEIISR